MVKYKVYHNADYLGETMAVSPQKAISNLRYKWRLMYEPMRTFRAVEV